MGQYEYDSSGVPERHKSFRPESDNECPQWKEVYEGIKKNINNGVIFAMVGNRGVGKTQLGASLIGFVALITNRSAMYCKAFDIFLRIRETINIHNGSERSAILRFVLPYFLVIDAYEVRSESQFENRTLDHIIDLRYDAIKPTLIISNDTPESFSRSVGPSIIDRISETGGIIEMNGKSFRKQMPVFKAYRYYCLKKSMKKTSRRINEFILLRDMETTDEIFEEYTDESRTRVNERSGTDA